MILLVDYFCNKAVLMDESYSLKTIHKDNLIQLMKQGKIKVENLILNADGTKIICSSGSLDRLDHMPKVATVISKSEGKFNCYVCTRETGNIGIAVFSEIAFKSMIKHQLVFNAFLRDSRIVIKGPLFNKLDAKGIKEYNQSVREVSKVVRSNGTIVFKDIKRVDEELSPTFFEISFNNEQIASKLVDILKKEYRQTFILGEPKGDSAFDSLIHSTSSYIKFAEKYGLEITFEISMYDIDELMEYAEDMDWVVKNFREFMVKYSEHKFELEDDVKEILQ